VAQVVDRHGRQLGRLERLIPPRVLRHRRSLLVVAVSVLEDEVAARRLFGGT